MSSSSPPSANAPTEPAAFRRLLTRAILLPLILMLTLAGVFLWQINRLLYAAELVDRTDQGIAQANHTQSLLVDMETGMRGYLIAGNVLFLEPYNRASGEIEPAFARLNSLVADNPAQVARVAAAHGLYAEWAQFARTEITLRNNGGDYLSPINSGTAKTRMDAMRAHFAAFIQTEEALRDERTRATGHATRIAVGTALTLTLLLGGLLAFIAYRQLTGLSRSYGQALAHVRESEERLSRAIARSPYPVIVHDQADRILAMSQGWTRFSGYTLEDLPTIGAWTTHAYGERSELMKEHIDRLFEINESVNNGEWEIKAKDGTRRVWDFWTTPLGSLPNGQRLLLSNAIDVTERKQAEQTLRFQAELLDTVDQAVIATDLQGTIIYWNRFAEKLYGWPATEAVGRQIVDVTPTDMSKGQGIDIMARLVAGESWAGEFMVQRRNGEAFPVWVADKPIFDSAGAAVGIVGCSVDITERKRAEEEREQLLRREQTARRAAEEASRLKDEFLATVSHELRTPLTAILGWARLLQTDGMDAATARRALDTIERNARAQAQLIEDLLDVSRVISGKLRLDVRPVELMPVIAAATDAVQPAADAKGITLRTDVAGAAPLVLGDAARLQQVVWNLLANAIKFTPSGGEVHIEIARRGTHAELTVRDTGEGIAPEFLPHVFERFRQADGSPTRTHGGLGLGLAIVRHLVELHGGVVNVTSAGAGQGATFTVQLPSLPDTDGAPDEPQATQQRGGNGQPQAAAAPLAGLHVLVVDDEPDARELLKMALTRGGARVTTADSATEALAALKRDSPDLLLSDIGMPEADGYMLMREVRALEAREGRPRLPAVALTAYARPEDQAQALSAGFHLHLPKPIEPTELIAALASLIGRA